MSERIIMVGCLLLLSEHGNGFIKCQSNKTILQSAQIKVTSHEGCVRRLFQLIRASAFLPIIVKKQFYPSSLKPAGSSIHLFQCKSYTHSCLGHEWTFYSFSNLTFWSWGLLRIIRFSSSVLTTWVSRQRIWFPCDTTPV